MLSVDDRCKYKAAKTMNISCDKVFKFLID